MDSSPPVIGLVPAAGGLSQKDGGMDRLVEWLDGEKDQIVRNGSRKMIETGMFT